MCNLSTERSKTIFSNKSVNVTVVETPALHADLIEKSVSASGLAAYAIDSFESMANDLEYAASEQELTAQLAQERVDQLTEIRDAAEAQARDNREAARKIRALIGTDTEEVAA